MKIVCNRCGSDDVWIEAHWYPNTNKTVTMEYEEENNFCEKCGTYTEFKEKKAIYKK